MCRKQFLKSQEVQAADAASAEACLASILVSSRRSGTAVLALSAIVVIYRESDIASYKSLLQLCCNFTLRAYWPA